MNENELIIEFKNSHPSDCCEVATMQGLQQTVFQPYRVSNQAQDKY